MAIKILTQEEAVKAFPRMGYKEFDPFQFLIVGNRSEIQKAISVSICIDGEQVPIGTIPYFEHSDRIGSGYQVQRLPEKGPIHVVVWGHPPKEEKPSKAKHDRLTKLQDALSAGAIKPRFAKKRPCGVRETFPGLKEKIIEPRKVKRHGFTGVQE